MIQKETQIRLIGYGSILMESSVAVMALVAASGLVTTSGIICGLWGYFLWVGVHEPFLGTEQE